MAASAETVTLHPRRWKSVLLALGSAVFAVPLALALVGYPNVFVALGALLFGAGVVAGVLQLFPSQAYLRFGPDGLATRSPLARAQRWAWNDVENFRGYEIHHRYHTTKHVGFDLCHLTPARQSFWQTLNRGFTGVDVTLYDTYGLDNHELADRLDAARSRWATEHGLSPSARADLELHREAARIRQNRVPAVTGLLAVACIVFYVEQTSRYGVVPDASELERFGAVSRDTLADGRWWTLLSAALLHGNPIHLLVNLVGLGIAGFLLEREIGWPRFALLALVSAAVSSAGAVLVHAHGVTVGVSGVIFAILGWAVVRDTHRTRALGAVAWTGLVFGVIYTFLVPATSIGGHLGGLAAGLLLGRLLKPPTSS